MYRNYLPLLSTFLLLTSCNDDLPELAQDNCEEQVESYTEPVVNKTAAADMGAVTSLGWNLGNQLDGHNNGVSSVTAWLSPKPEKALFEKIYSYGIKCIRIPVTWMGHIGSAPGYKIADDWLNTVETYVDYAEECGFEKIVINIHHDGGKSEPTAADTWLNRIGQAETNESVNTAIKAQLAAMWKQIATKFRNKSAALIYETMNEIHDGGWGWGTCRHDGGKMYGIMNDWQKVCYDAIRTVDTQHYVALVHLCQDPLITLGEELWSENHRKLAIPNEAQKVMVAVHYYTPNDFSLNVNKTEWGHTGTDVVTGDDSGTEDKCQALFKKLHDEYVAKGIPCYIGEMGATRRASADQEKFRRYWMRYVVRCAMDNGLQPYIWDNGGSGTGAEQSGMFNRQTGEFLNEDSKHVVEDMIWAMQPTVTLQQIYTDANCEPMSTKYSWQLPTVAKGAANTPLTDNTGTDDNKPGDNTGSTDGGTTKPNALRVVFAK